MLDHEPDELGPDLRHDALGVGTAPGIQLPMLLPQLEEAFDLPACAVEAAGFVEIQAVGRDVGHEAASSPPGPAALD